MISVCLRYGVPVAPNTKSPHEGLVFALLVGSSPNGLVLRVAGVDVVVPLRGRRKLGSNYYATPLTLAELRA